jgi:hypothetical protein
MGADGKFDGMGKSVESLVKSSSPAGRMEGAPQSEDTQPPSFFFPLSPATGTVRRRKRKDNEERGKREEEGG